MIALDAHVFVLTSRATNIRVNLFHRLVRMCKNEKIMSVGILYTDKISPNIKDELNHSSILQQNIIR